MISSLTNLIENSIQIIFTNYHFLAYLVTFLVIFIETGLVIFPFLPGDSLLFLVGTIISSQGITELLFLFILLSLAAILGDSINYFIGDYSGRKILQKGWIKKEHLEKTNLFYKKYGIKTILFARFIPLVRTIAPFVAGIGKMDYKRFLLYNVVGGITWVFIFLFGGYFFGNLPVIKENLTVFILAIILISLVPGIIHFIKSQKSKF